MASAATPASSTNPPQTPTATPQASATPQPHPRWPWLKYVTPLLVLLLAAAVVITITRNWNGWEGGAMQQTTDDAFVRGDLTPLSTKVAGIMRSVRVGDYQ